MKRVLVYSHDTYGLGNIRRMLTICEHLCDVHQDVSILIVSGSPMLHAFRLSPRIDYVKLPCLSRTDSGRYEVKSLGLGYAETVRMRKEMLRTAVVGFAPDLVLVDKKPFGIDDELRPALDAAQAMLPKPRLVLLLRDILDAPERTRRIWRKNNYFDAIEKFFDSVLVPGSQEVFDLPTEYDFSRESAARVEFCGYLGRPSGEVSIREIRNRHGIARGRQMVLVTPGGGADGELLLDSYARALRLMTPSSDDSGFVSIVVSGPEVSPGRHGEIRRLVSGRADVRLLQFTDDMASYIQAADLVVSMAGYNTICEVLSANRPSIVVPRVRPVQEQLVRSQLLAERGLVHMIHPDDLTPDAFAGSVAAMLARPPAPLQTLDFQGLERVEKHLAGLIGDG